MTDIIKKGADEMVRKPHIDGIETVDVLSEFIKYFDESDFDIIHNDEYGEYQPSRFSLKDIFETFLETKRHQIGSESNS